MPAPFETVQTCPEGLVVDRHVVGLARGQQRGERERPVGADAQRVATVVLEEHRARQPRHRTADRLRARFAQDTVTLVTLAEATVPGPVRRPCRPAQRDWLDRHVVGRPVASSVANVNDPLALMLRSSPPLSCRATVPESPETVPPTESVPRGRLRPPSCRRSRRRWP